MNTWSCYQMRKAGWKIQKYHLYKEQTRTTPNAHSQRESWKDMYLRCCSLGECDSTMSMHW